jgi:hypothetical protein
VADFLAQEENWIVTTELLKVAHSVDGEVKEVNGEAEGVNGNICDQGVYAPPRCEVSTATFKASKFLTELAVHDGLTS